MLLIFLLWIFFKRIKCLIKNKVTFPQYPQMNKNSNSQIFSYTLFLKNSLTEWLEKIVYFQSIQMIERIKMQSVRVERDRRKVCMNTKNLNHKESLRISGPRFHRNILTVRWGPEIWKGILLQLFKCQESTHIYNIL